MTETPEEVRHITQLPIFIWSEVLLPYETPLDAVHIDKPADRQLLADITFGDRFFGVTNKYLAEKKTGLPYINGVGCIAALVESNTFAGGDSNIKMRGISRYRIARFVETGKPYPVAEIIFFNDIESEPEKLESLTREACLLVQEMMTKMLRTLGAPAYEAPLLNPPDFDLFSFTMASLFSFDLGEQLKLLQANSARIRLESGIRVLKKILSGVEDNIERKKLLAAFQNIKNNPTLG
ncbi:MAG TPA: LON peptidase substrate-binding domain-containing protein [Pyrinomonadaceae bacterium]|jgi:Lon protease-like protein